MLRSRSLLVLGAFIMLGGATSRDPQSPQMRFVLCDQPPNAGSRIILDYGTKWGLNEDVAQPVQFCTSDQACILSPFVFGAPPHFPRTSSDQVRWSIDGHHFVMGRETGDSGYWITVNSPPVEVNGRSWPRDRMRYRYDIANGITELRRLADDHRWHRCEGQLRFEDLVRLRTDPNPTTPQPPLFETR